MSLKIYLKNNKGFTLIELLVVISIIGLLSSIVLTSLNDARNKAKDTAIKESVHQFTNLMALNYDEYGSYANLKYSWMTPTICNTKFTGIYKAQAVALCTHIYNNANPTPYRFYGYTSPNNTDTYSFMVKLNNGHWYCVGSSGRKGEYTEYNGVLLNPGGLGHPGCFNRP